MSKPLKVALSKPLKVALVVEGPTDAIVIKAAIRNMLAGRDVVFQTLQPEGSDAFDGIGGSTGLGWAGVFRWCRQTADEGGGRVAGSYLFRQHDLLVVQLDADVAEMTYESGRIRHYERNDLPCVEPCPPPSATTDKLRLVMLNWMGHDAEFPRCVLCTPSKSVEAWVVTALFPSSPVAKRADWECRSNPASQLATQPMSSRIRKCVEDYGPRSGDLEKAWPRVREKHSEAKRFSERFLTEMTSGTE